MKIKRLLVSLACAVLVCLSVSDRALASQATSYTYTVDEDHYWFRTQDAYLPDKTITDLGLTQPEDIFIDKNDIMYIADSGNSRVVIYDINKDEVSGEIKYSEFQSPKGVFVTRAGEIYVADSKAKSVFVFNADHSLKTTYGRPDSPTFADTPYEPVKVAVDNRKNIYIIGEGVSNGIIQIAESGDFLGFFAVNKTKLSFRQKLQSLFFTREQLAGLLNWNPPTFSNLCIDDKGIVYSTTMGSHFDGLKKHRTDGGNIYSAGSVWGWENMTDICVNDKGIIVTCSKDGYVIVYTPSGELIYEFGAGYFGKDVAGLYTSLSTVALDSKGTVWTADSYKGYIQSFKATEYAGMVYDSLDLFEQGRYDDALKSWTDVLRLNQMSLLAHDGIGKAYLYNREYENAMEHFKVSANRVSYSDAFWEVRNTWLQHYLSYVMLGILGLFILSKIVSAIDKKHKIKQAKAALKGKLSSLPVIGEIMYACRIPFHPFDRYYDIRVEKNGDAVTASILYVAFFGAYMLFTVGKGYIYQVTKVENMDINAIVLGFFAISGLFVLCNWLVSSINDGEGTLKKVYILVAYGSVPAGISLLAVTGLSYVMTLNETFILSLILFIGVAWSLILIFIGLQVIHDYSGKETVRSILITFLFMLIIAVVLLVVIIMWDQVWKFIESVWKELIRNVIR